MKHRVELTGYLPEFLREYSETGAALMAEEPEFTLLWDSADRVLRNQFIETADEYGISRLERIMGILPSSADSLESRRALVRSRWTCALPYTLKALIYKLTAFCGGNDFRIIRKFDSLTEGYTISVITHIRPYSEVLELKRLLNEMIPVNMVIDSFNSIAIIPEGKAGIYTGLGLFGRHKKIKSEVNVYGLE